MKKLTMLALSGCLLFSGCGRGESAKNADATKPVEITMWLVGSEGQAITINEIARDFYGQTGIKVKCDAISWQDAHSKYLTSIAGGVAPDIGTMGLTWGAEFGDLKSMVDLKKEYPDEVDAIKKSVFPGLWNSVEYQGRLYGIPFDMTLQVLYYRNDMISRAPDTWAELKAIIADLGRDGKGMLFDWGSLNWIGYSPFMWQAGGDYYNKDYSEITLSSAACVTGMEFFADLYRKHNIPKTKIPLEQGMRTGEFPIAISGNWKIDGLKLLAPEISGKWSIAMLPAGPAGKRTAFIGGRIMGIFEQSKHKNEAWSFIRYLLSAKVQERLYEAALAEQATYLPPIRDNWAALEMDGKIKEVLMAQANDAKGPPAAADWDSNARYVDEAIQKVILQNADVARELEAARLNIQRASSRR